MLQFRVKYEFWTKRCSNCSRVVFMRRFHFFLLITDHFQGFKAFLKKYKLKRKFSDNLGPSICRLFQFLEQFFFTTSETGLDYYHQKVSVRVASRVAERLNTQDLRKLGNFKKIPEKLGFDGEYPAFQPKAKL